MCPGVRSCLYVRTTTMAPAPEHVANRSSSQLYPHTLSFTMNTQDTSHMHMHSNQQTSHTRHRQRQRGRNCAATRRHTHMSAHQGHWPISHGRCLAAYRLMAIHLMPPMAKNNLTCRGNTGFPSDGTTATQGPRHPAPPTAAPASMALHAAVDSSHTLQFLPVEMCASSARVRCSKGAVSAWHGTTQLGH